MDAQPNSFSLQASKNQKWLDVAFGLVSLALLWPYLTFWSILLVVALYALACAFLWRAKLGRLEFGPQGFWYYAPLGAPRLLPWCKGSVLRPDLIIWRYGFWPWQRLLLRPDSLKAGQYYELVRLLRVHLAL